MDVKSARDGQPGAGALSHIQPGFGAAAPLRPTDRIDAIDALRGIALFGVLIVNLVTEFRVSIFEQFLIQRPIQGPLDRVLEALLMLLLAQKALALFSLLFGIGLAIQFDKLRGNTGRVTLLVRRLAVLLAIGFVHLFLVWNGDILTEYAIVGFVVLPFLFGPRGLLAAAGAAFLGCFLLMPLWPSILPFPSQGWIAEHTAEATRVYGTGSFMEVLAFRIREIPAVATLHFLIFPRTVGLFLLGALLWRTGLLRRIEMHRLVLFAFGVTALVVGISLSLIDGEKASWGRQALGLWYFTIGRSTPIILALGYGAIVLAAMTTSAKKMLAWAAPLGRMAFTNYLLQSIILGWIFYGYGLGWFGFVGVAAAFGIGVLIYILQALASAWWLNRFRFGPVEWLWRTLMYGTVQPMRLRSSAC
jgi:uncharacterized protein